MKLGTIEHLIKNYLMNDARYYEWLCQGSKVKVMEVRKVRKWPISKLIYSTDMHIIKRLMMNYDTLQDNIW